MQYIKTINLKYILPVLSALALNACGGGSSSSSSAAYRGQFIDSPVSGLNWATATRSGVTDKDGYFEYDNKGESISFSVGNLPLGSVKADNKIHVFDFGKSTDDELNNKALRIAQLLQTLDADSNPSNGIQLSSEVKEKFSSTTAVNFNVEQARWDSQMASVSGMFGGKKVVTLEAAYAHASNNIEKDTNCSVPAKTYTLPSGNFNSQWLTCNQRAKLEAFVRNVQPELTSIQMSDYNAGLAYLQEDNINDISKVAINSSALKSALSIGVNSIKALDASLSPGQQLAFLTAFAKLHSDVMNYYCNVMTICNEQNATQSAKNVKLIVGTVTSTASCFMKSFDDCAKAVADVWASLPQEYASSKNQQEIMELIKINFKAIADIVGSDLSKAKGIANAGGSIAEAFIKNVSASAGLDGDAKLWTNLLAETVNSFITCTHFSKLNIWEKTSLTQLGVDCLDKAGNYLIDKSITIGVYGAAIVDLTKLNLRNNEYEIANYILSERYKYSTLDELFKAQGISLRESVGHHPFTRLVYKMASKYDVDTQINTREVDYDAIFDIYEKYQLSVDYYAEGYMSGKYNNCSNVTLSSLLVNGGRPYLAEMEYGKPVTLTANSTGVVKKYLFNWGDGTSTFSDLPGAQHTFSAEKYYTVSVEPIVHDSKGAEVQCSGKKISENMFFTYKTKDTEVLKIETSPVSLVVNQPIEFTVIGIKIPLKSILSINGAQCSPPTNNTPAGFKQKCTSTTAGEKKLNIFTGPDGINIATANVNFAAACTNSVSGNQSGSPGSSEAPVSGLIGGSIINGVTTKGGVSLITEPTTESSGRSGFLPPQAPGRTGVVNNPDSASVCAGNFN